MHFKSEVPKTEFSVEKLNTIYYFIDGFVIASKTSSLILSWESVERQQNEEK